MISLVVNGYNKSSESYCSKRNHILVKYYTKLFLSLFKVFKKI